MNVCSTAGVLCCRFSVYQNGGILLCIQLYKQAWCCRKSQEVELSQVLVIFTACQHSSLFNNNKLVLWLIRGYLASVGWWEVWQPSLQGGSRSLQWSETGM